MVLLRDHKAHRSDPRRNSCRGGGQRAGQRREGQSGHRLGSLCAHPLRGLFPQLGGRPGDRDGLQDLHLVIRVEAHRRHHPSRDPTGDLRLCCADHEGAHETHPCHNRQLPLRAEHGRRGHHHLLNRCQRGRGGHHSDGRRRGVLVRGDDGAGPHGHGPGPGLGRCDGLHQAPAGVHDRRRHPRPDPPGPRALRRRAPAQLRPERYRSSGRGRRRRPRPRPLEARRWLHPLSCRSRRVSSAVCWRCG
mmetsp:Transcript_21335/g.66565  ORF Transcript_21335/g.66565 Transcript_21335/m.66565 type:complete len:247 (+) Transcript_21335:1345-2085(+)